jgi:hypothetical protein
MYRERSLSQSSSSPPLVLLYVSKNSVCRVWCSSLAIGSVWNKGELPQQWKEAVIIPTYKKGDRTVCNNYGGISLLSASHKILTSIFSQG